MENNSTPEQKWYDKTWLVVVLCIFFFPVGLYALWKNASIAKGWKIGVTVFFALVVLAQLGKDKSKTDGTADNSSTSTASTPALTQAQKDSFAKAEQLAAIEERKNQTITAGDIVSSYEANEVSADENFKGKKFYVEGYIDNIGKDILDDIYVTLEAGNGIRSVQCYIDDKDRVKNLQKGQKITVFGKCDGLMMNVLMKNCKLVDNLSDLQQ